MKQVFGKGGIDMKNMTNGTRVFNIFNYLFMVLLMIVTLYPFIYIVFASISNASLLIAHSGPILMPLGFNLDAYKAVLKYDVIWSGYLNTLFIVVVGVAINIVLTSFGAYALSRKGFMWKKHIMLFIVFTMFFSGGLIPFYFTVKELGMYNTLWSVIIPGAIGTFNLIILRSAFEAVPISLEESAKIDGAGHFLILSRIIFPLSLPTIAVVALYYAVGHWNAWFNASIFIADRSIYPLQLVLREILIGNDTNSIASTNDIGEQMQISETIKYAVIIVSTLPILVAYPYLQKYFVKGTMIGAVKE